MLHVMAREQMTHGLFSLPSCCLAPPLALLLLLMSVDDCELMLSQAT